VLRIDRLQLRLPGEYQAHAHRIARLVARELAAMPVETAGDFDRLAVPPIVVAPGMGSRVVAKQIAVAVKGRLKAMQGRPPAAGIHRNTNQTSQG
jgi:hypothetical protein